MENRNQWRLLVALMVLCVPYHVADARWAYANAHDLVSESDLIVVGTLSRLYQWTDQGTDHAIGRIEIEHVLVGSPPSPGFVRLEYSNSTDLICPRVAHDSAANHLALWLLTIRPDGTVRADYPRRSLVLSDNATVLRFIEELRDSEESAQVTVRQWLQQWIDRSAEAEQSNSLLNLPGCPVTALAGFSR